MEADLFVGFGRVGESPEDEVEQQQRVGREQAIRAEPAVPEQGGVSCQCEVEQGEGGALDPPSGYLRKLASAVQKLERGKCTGVARRG